MRATWCLTPLFGSVTTGAVAKMLGRNFIGCERDLTYADAARARIAAVDPVDPEALKAVPEKRSEPRYPLPLRGRGRDAPTGRGAHRCAWPPPGHDPSDGRLSLGPAIRFDPQDRRSGGRGWPPATAGLSGMRIAGGERVCIDSFSATQLRASMTF